MTTHDTSASLKSPHKHQCEEEKPLASNRGFDTQQKEEDRGSSSSPFVRNEADKASRCHFSLAHAFRCAFSGIAYVIKTQRNMKIHLALALIALILGGVFSLSAGEWLAVVLCIGAVFSVECLNTSIESIVDLVSPTYHDLARYAKDAAAGAVCIVAGMSVVVAAIIFLPKLIALASG